MKTRIHTKYKTKDGTLVPGVTTVLGMLEKPALIHWAWKLGVQGEDYRKVREKAANIGTVAHYLIQCYLKKEKPDLTEFSPAVVDKAETAFLAFLDFEKAHHLKTIHCEKELVSKKLKFGGTADWYGELDGKACLLDFKTGSGLYPEMKLQVAAYKELLLENDHIVEGTHLLRIDKETGEFHHYILNNHEEAWKMFKLLLKVYPLKKKIWKR